MQSGASDDCPLIFSNNSIDEPTPAKLSAGFASIFTLVADVGADAGLLAAAGAATGAASAFGSESSSTTSGVYSPDSNARARSDAVYKPIAERVSNGR